MTDRLEGDDVITKSFYSKRDRAKIYEYAEYISRVAPKKRIDDRCIVDIYELLRLCDGELIMVDGLEDDARLVKDSAGLGFEIAVPYGIDKLERRFAIARELGRAILYFDYPDQEWKDCCNISGGYLSDVQEMILDYFAEGLLIPEEDFLRRIKDEDIDVNLEGGGYLVLDDVYKHHRKSIIRIADDFKVPVNRVLSRGLGIGVFRAF